LTEVEMFEGGEDEGRSEKVLRLRYVMFLKDEGL